MRVHRVYIPELQAGENILPSQEAHHLARVLRVKPQQAIQAFDGKGYYADGVVATVNGTQVTVELASKQRSEVEPARQVTLAVGLPKGDAFETIVRMGTELGAVAFIPLLTEYGDVRVLKPNRLERYRRIALEATKQCGRSFVPAVHPLQTLEEFITSSESQPEQLKLVAHPYTTQTPHALDMAAQNTAVAVVGPEGGLSQQEVNILQSKGFRSLQLGKQILRVDTATVKLLSLLLNR